MWPKLMGLDARRERLLRKCQPGPLQDYYKHPFPDKNQRIQDVTFAVLDFETTGLDINNDQIISIGIIEIEKLGIQLNTSWHQIVKTSWDIPQETAVIHQITDDMVAEGLELDEAMRSLLQRLKGHVLIAHHANIELGFINNICHALYNQEFFTPTIDTQCLAKRQLLRQHDVIKEGTLRLFNLRKKYGMPAYKAHNALSDALATAELFLALFNDLYPQQNCRLKDLLT